MQRPALCGVVPHKAANVSRHAVPSCMCGFVRRNGGRKRIVHIGGSAGDKLRAKLN